MLCKQILHWACGKILQHLVRLIFGQDCENKSPKCPRVVVCEVKCHLDGIPSPSTLSGTLCRNLVAYPALGEGGQFFPVHGIEHILISNVSPQTAFSCDLAL